MKDSLTDIQIVAFMEWNGTGVRGMIEVESKTLQPHDNQGIRGKSFMMEKTNVAHSTKI